MKMSLFAGKMERELFNYMKFDGGTMPFNEDAEFEASLVENYVYIIPQVCTDLGSLIENTEPGNFRSFLPLRFYVKSFLVILNPPKLPF